ncbi:hypothetical protein GCM10022279_04650 [Comamonas faecalis]|uniref:Flagellar basal body rod protein n=1 Tax=Comamonas faecalis TaxID=1387849 RepID=A0ABP7QL98_9BURK
MSPSFTIARSGLQAAQLHLDAAAHNTANLQTHGFRSTVVQQQAEPGAGVRAQAVANTGGAPSLETQAVQQLAATYAFKANAVALRISDETAGHLLDTRA